MNDAITITTLVENTVNTGGVQAEHGLASLIRAGRQKLLFDTGQSDL
jgi:metal-dependent hydrolase (beta-lactamase superfamily II)